MRALIRCVQILILVSLSSCDQINENNANDDLAKDTSTIAIIQFDKRDEWLFTKGNKPVDLTQTELQEIDSLYYSCIKEYNSTLSEKLKMIYGIDVEKFKYKRQYVAVMNTKGEKEVWINCFCDDEGINWKGQIMEVDDGGNCYFNLKINLNTKTCFDFSVNGEA